jgi:hypothetical protein
MYWSDEAKLTEFLTQYKIELLKKAISDKDNGT